MFELLTRYIDKRQLLRQVCSLSEVAMDDDLLAWRDNSNCYVSDLVGGSWKRDCIVMSVNVCIDIIYQCSHVRDSLYLSRKEELDLGAC